MVGLSKPAWTRFSIRAPRAGWGRSAPRSRITDSAAVQSLWISSSGPVPCTSSTFGTGSPSRYMANRADRQVSGPTCKPWLSLLPRVENETKTKGNEMPVRERSCRTDSASHPGHWKPRTRTEWKQTYPQNDHSPWIECLLRLKLRRVKEALAAVPQDRFRARILAKGRGGRKAQRSHQMPPAGAGYEYEFVYCPGSGQAEKRIFQRVPGY